MLNVYFNKITNHYKKGLIAPFVSSVSAEPTEIKHANDRKMKIFALNKATNSRHKSRKRTKGVQATKLMRILRMKLG